MHATVQTVIQLKVKKVYSSQCLP